MTQPLLVTPPNPLVLHQQCVRALLLITTVRPMVEWSALVESCTPTHPTSPKVAPRVIMHRWNFQQTVVIPRQLIRSRTVYHL